MSKPVILFNKSELEHIYNLLKVLSTKDIAEQIYPELSMALIYRQVERANLLVEQPSKKLIEFLFPPWIYEEKNCIINFYNLPENKFVRYKNIFRQPAQEWVLVGHTYNHNGRWYPKSTPQKYLK